MRSFWIGILLSIAVGQATAEAQIDQRERLAEAIEVYQDALDETDRDRRVDRFRRAQTLFESMIDQRRSESSQQPIRAELYFNLGNAALGAEDLGSAILAFRRALRTQPNHRRAEQNLLFARSLLPGWVPLPDQATPAGFQSLIDGRLSVRSLNGIGLPATAFLVAAIFTAVYLRSGKVWIRNLAILAGLLWIALLIVTTSDTLIDQDHSMNRPAVVRAAEVVARSADSIHAPAKIREPLPGGTEVTILDDRVDWLRVRLSDGREVWLPANAVDPV